MVFGTDMNCFCWFIAVTNIKLKATIFCYSISTLHFSGGELLESKRSIPEPEMTVDGKFKCRKDNQEYSSREDYESQLHGRSLYDVAEIPYNACLELFKFRICFNLGLNSPEVPQSILHYY